MGRFFCLRDFLVLGCCLHVELRVFQRDCEVLETKETLAYRWQAPAVIDSGRGSQFTHSLRTCRVFTLYV